MNFKIESLNWVKKHGLKPMDSRTALNALNFLIDDALSIAETNEDITLCNQAKLNAMRYI